MRIMLIILCFLYVNAIHAQIARVDSNGSLTYEQIQQQAEHIDMSGWQTFADHVQTCTPSTFDLPNPIQIKAFTVVAASMGDITQNVNPVAASFTQEEFDRMLAASSVHIEILGWLDKNCQVRMSMATGPIDKIPGSDMVLTKNCLIPKDSVPFVLENAKRLTSGSMRMSLLGSDPLNNIISSFCK